MDVNTQIKQKMRGYNSTIQRKKKLCSRCGHMEYIFSHGMCRQCTKIKLAGMADNRESEEDNESVAILKKDADLLFSRLIRLRAASPTTGLLTCFICDNLIHYSAAHAMHYEGRSDSALRLHPKNVRPGCVKCNVHKDGNLQEYARRLDEEELGLSEWLYAEGKSVYKFTRDELKRFIADYTREINHLKKIKGLK